MSRRRSLPASLMRITTVMLAMTASAGAMADNPTDGPNDLFGVGMQRMPAWLGSKDHRNQPIPYVQAELPWHITLSTLDGLTVDLIHGDKWRGGLYGNYTWGRDREELGPKLGGVVDSLAPRINAGGYLEYQATAQLNLGTELSHDTKGAGAYLNLYADYDLPAIGYLNHSLQVQWQVMNGPAMRRFFGVTPEQAAQLDISPWSPGAGSQQIEFEYDAYMPTSLHTGFALAINYTRLLGQAAESPLVREYGSRNQVTTTLAFVYRL
jgi:outer membrane scaffolding protein for murein synthesis (MipA/OmpV family)